jgi:hydrogenase expression/formation protein HypE
MEEFITLDYGSGGKKTSRLIENMLLPAFDSEELSKLGDGAILQGNEEIVFSTDSFVVNPYFFPGGDIGKLAVCGTVNDICMCGGIPRYLSLGLIIEEGFPMDHLNRIVESIRRTCQLCDVKIVTGDTKVVERGKGDGIYINTSGVGFLEHKGLSPLNIKKGDVVIVSGNIGDHGTAVMLSRNSSFMESSVISDCAPLHRLTEKLRLFKDDIRVLRDPTRGGVATTLNEFVEGSRLSIELNEKDIPISNAVSNVCQVLGLDPLYCANEGKLLAIAAPDKAEEILEEMKSLPEGKDAAIIGSITDSHAGRVVMRTEMGGTHVLTKLTGAQLPRIC